MTFHIIANTPCLPGHAADIAVVAGCTIAGVVIQVLGEARSADTGQPATDIVGVGIGH